MWFPEVVCHNFHHQLSKPDFPHDFPGPSVSMQVAAVRKRPAIERSPASDEDDNEESEVQWEKFKSWKMSKKIEDECEE